MPHKDPIVRQHYQKRLGQSRITFKDQRIYNPNKIIRTGICSQCGRNVAKGEIKRTNLHHVKYDPEHPTANTVELCVGCHAKETARLDPESAIQKGKRLSSVVKAKYGREFYVRLGKAKAVKNQIEYQGLKGTRKDIVFAIAKQLDSEGVPKQKISTEVSRRLKGVVSAHYIIDVLPIEYKDSNKRRPKHLRGGSD